MKSRNWFWGIVFVAIGVLALLASLDVIDFSWAVALRLWPMVFIFVGIAMLPFKDWLKTTGTKVGGCFLNRLEKLRLRCL